MGKPRGIRAGRKLHLHRKDQRWADKRYKKSRNAAGIKNSPFQGASHAEGIVTAKFGIESKQPNSAVRKCVRVQLIKNDKLITAYVPWDGCLNFIDDKDKVLVSGFGRSGRAVGDIPGVRFKVVKCCKGAISLLALYKGKRTKTR